MVQATGGIQSSNAANSILFNGTASVGSTDFTQQLMTAIEGLLKTSGNGSQFEIDITPKQGQNSDGSQLTVTVKNVSSPAAQASTASAAKAQTTTGSLMSALEPQLAASPAATTPASTSTDDGSDVANMTPDDAYWASQPAAVQALRDMPADQRYYAAEALAQQGYTIDVPIMVNGMDPLATMMQRQADGYTWVPSALQANIPVGPGISWPGPVYDPNSPPPGSVLVTTSFAAGTNMQDPWISKQDITANLAATSS